MCGTSQTSVVVCSIPASSARYSRWCYLLSKGSGPRSTGTVALPGKPMTDRTKHGAEGSVTSAQLAEILDKLAAVDLDLEPICKVGEEAPLVIVAHRTEQLGRNAACQFYSG